MEKIDILFSDYKVSDMHPDKMEYLLSELRSLGYSQIETVKLLILKLDMNISDADKIILNSKVWSSERDITLRIRKNFEEGMSE